MKYAIIIYISLMSFMELWAQSFPRANFSGYDEEGLELQHAFLGGLNNPFVQTIDLDLDGQDELWLLGRVGEVSLAYKYIEQQWIYDEQLSKKLPRVNEWMITKDFNGDGLKDIFTNSLIPGIGAISVYFASIDEQQIAFNLGTFPQFRFDILSYESRPGQFTNAYVAPDDLPAIGDVDSDGDLDILSFEPGGSTIIYYRNTQVEDGLPADQFHFVLDDSCWGKVVEDGLSSSMTLGKDSTSCGNNLYEPQIEIRHAGSSLLIIDRNGDGRQDVVVGDIGSPKLINLINKGSLANAFITEIETDFPKESEATNLPIFPFPMQVDFNQDGVLDFLASPGDKNNSENVKNLWYYENQATDLAPVYLLQNKETLNDQMFDFGSLSVPAIIDLNGDGFKDLLVGTRGKFPSEITSDSRIIYLENDGNGGFAIRNEDFLGLSSLQGETAIFSPSTGDLDGDGDIDLLIGEASGRLIYLENIAAMDQVPQFAKPVLPFQNIDVGVQSHPNMIDMNQDGLTDLVIGERNGNVNYFENIGQIGQPQFPAEPDQDFLGAIDTRVPGFVLGSSTPFTFLTAEGLVMLVGSQSEGITAYSDLNTDTIPFIIKDTLWGQIWEGERVSVVMDDLDNDGILEAVVGNQRGGIGIYQSGLSKFTTSKKKNLKPLELTIYPNPVRDNVTLSISHTNHSAKCSVLSISGQLLLSFEFLNNQVIDLSNLFAGLYFIRIEVNQQQIVKKLIKK